MDYGPKIRMRDDILWFLRLGTDVLKLKVVPKLLCALIIFHIFTSFIQLCYFLIKPDEFLMHGSIFLGYIYVIAACIFFVWKKKSITNMWEHLELWDISNADERLQAEIKSDVNWNFRFVVFKFISAIIVSIVGFIPANYEEDVLSFIFVAQRMFPILREYSLEFQITYKLLTVALGYWLVMIPDIILYNIYHTKFQIRLLMFYVFNTDSGIEETCEKDLVRNFEYQKIIKYRLEFCIKRHIEILRLQNGFRKDVIEAAFVLLSWSGFLFMFCFVITLSQLQNYKSINLLLFCIVVFVIGVFSSFVAIFHSGQLIQDEFEKLDNAYSVLRWYNWNSENRKLLIMGRDCFINPFKLRFSTNYVLNYDLAVTVARGLYSLTSLLISSRNKWN